MNKEPLDLSPIAEEIVSTLQEEEPREDISIKIESDLKTVGDPRLLSVALENMLQNALKFTARAENPKIEVGRLNNGGREVFYVKDNGAGFDQEYANTLFGVFQRLHKSTEFEGTGIGLATVDRIIKRHGGEIWGVGDLDKGATFYFSIPS